MAAQRLPTIDANFISRAGALNVCISIIISCIVSMAGLFIDGHGKQQNRGVPHIISKTHIALSSNESRTLLTLIFPQQLIPLLVRLAPIGFAVDLHYIDLLQFLVFQTRQIVHLR